MKNSPARVDESEAKEKFMRLNAEETLSQLENVTNTTQ